MQALKDYIINSAAGKFLSVDEDGYIKQYNTLLKAKRKGKGNAMASSYVDVWEAFEDETVAKLVEHIDGEIQSLNEFIETVKNLQSQVSVKGVNQDIKISLTASGGGTRKELTNSLSEFIGFLSKVSDHRLTHGRLHFRNENLVVAFN